MIAPALSVVVMSYRNESTIVACVASLVAQRSALPFEIVVVTSGDDESASLIRQRFPHITVVDSPHRLLPGGARNVGVAASTGDALAFLAADCIAAPGWVAARIDAHRRNHAAVASAITTVPERPAAWALHFDMYCSRLRGRPPGYVAGDDPAAHGISFDRSLLERIGPFDDTARFGEDTKAAARVAELGVGIWFEPAVVTVHGGPRRCTDMLRESHRRSVRNGRIAARTMPPINRLRVVGEFGRMWWKGMRRRMATAWRYGSRRERVQLVLSVGWLAGVRAAALAGWYSERTKSQPDWPRA